MGMFKNSTKETKEFESIILDIEKERDTISWCHTTIQSCLWNLENPKVERWVIDWCVRDLRENLNKKEEAILIKNSINIFSEPFSSTGKVIAVVNEGTKIQLLNFQGSWSEVIVNNGEKGWIPSSSYLELNK